MSLTFIDTNKLDRRVSADGVAFSEVLNERLCGAKNVLGSLRWLEAGQTLKVPGAEKQQLIYVMEGGGTIRLNAKDYEVEKGAGVYLGPSETAEILASASRPMKLFHLEVPQIPSN